jgi:hypothetical protein
MIAHVGSEGRQVNHAASVCGALFSCPVPQHPSVIGFGLCVLAGKAYQAGSPKRCDSLS